MNNKDISILILAFNRPKHFNRCLERILDQGIRNIYISIDGPRGILDKSKQDLILDKIETYKEKFNIKVRRSSINKGCRNAVIDGIDWFFNNVDQGIIIEDDISISDNCLLAFIQLLKDYKSNKNIMTISSHNEFINFNEQVLIKSPVWRAWGWATWREKWLIHKEFSKKATKYSINKINSMLPKSIANIYSAELIKSCQLGLFDTWDFEFNFSHLALGYSSLTISGYNSVNFGFDIEATHTKESLEDSFKYKTNNNNKINTSEIIEMDIETKELTLSKCCFTKNKIENKLKEGFISKKISLIFLLRKIKRSIIKRLDYLNKIN